MPTTGDDPSRSRFEVTVTSASHFSWLSTRMGVETTFLAWVRTAISLIGFGFTIVQFFERFSDMSGIDDPSRPDAPRYIGLALIGVGVVSLLIAMWQYRRLQNYLWSGDFHKLAGAVEDRPQHTPAQLVALALLFVGIFAFGAVLVRAF